MGLLTLLAATEGRAFHLQSMEQQLLVAAAAVLVATQVGLAELAAVATEGVQVPMELRGQLTRVVVVVELNKAPTPQVMAVLAL